MNARGFRHAERALAKVQTCFARLQQADDLEEVADAWEDFLQAAAKVYEKFRAASRGDPQTWGWFGRVEEERRSDPLLCYLHHARNADFHRFEEIVEPAGPIHGIKSTGGVRINSLQIIQGRLVSGSLEPTSPASEITISMYPSHLRLLPVTDRGIVYDVPTQHEGREVGVISVMKAAELAVGYLNRLVVAASQFLR